MSGRDLQRPDVVTRYADCFDCALVLHLGKFVPDAFESLGPLGILHAVDQADFEHLGVEFLAEAIHLRFCSARRHIPELLSRPDLGQNTVVVSRNALEGSAHVGVCTIEVGHVHEPDSLVQAVPYQFNEFFFAQTGVGR